MQHDGSKTALPNQRDAIVKFRITISVSFSTTGDGHGHSVRKSKLLLAGTHGVRRDERFTVSCIAGRGQQDGQMQMPHVLAIMKDSGVQGRD